MVEVVQDNDSRQRLHGYKAQGFLEGLLSQPGMEGMREWPILVRAAAVAAPSFP